MVSRAIAANVCSAISGLTRSVSMFILMYMQFLRAIQGKVRTGIRSYLAPGIVLFAAVIVLASPGKASALASYGPDSSEFGGAPQITYYLGNTNNVAGADRLAVPIYFEAKPTSIVAIDVTYYSGTAKVVFFINSVPGSIATSLYGLPNKVSINPAAFTQDIETGRWVAYIYGVKEPGYGSSRTFRLQTQAPYNSTAVIGYSSEKNSNKFAISNRERCDVYDPAKGKVDPGCGRFWDYSLPFAPSCSIETGVEAMVELYDGDNVTGADIRSIQYDKKFAVFVYDATSGKTVPWKTTGYDELAMNSKTARFTFIVTQGHKYTLKLTNVYANNVLQFKLPYDSINYLKTCPKPKATCDATIVPGTMLVGDKVVLGVRFKLSTSYSDPPMNDENPKMTASMKSPLGAVTDFGKRAYTVSGTGGNTTLSSDPKIEFIPKMHGVYTLTWTLSGNMLQEAVTCTQDIDAVYQPFFTVTNGDIFSPGDIISWNGNNNPDSGIGYNGAGTNLAALASGSIQHFVTGTSLTSPGDRTGLAFANTTSANPTYGGGYPVIAYSPLSGSVATASPGTLDLSTLTSGVYTYNGDLTISGQLQPGVGVTIHLESGNLYIASPGVTYASYTAPNEIPRLSVYVKAGNIYVDNDVSEIRGMYYAGGTGKGNFYSCASGMGVPIDLATSPTGYDDCNKKLTIYGAVAANNLILLRTWGNLGAFYTPDPVHPSESAEEFVYSPELWMVPDATTKTGPVKFDLYTSLAPVL